MKTIDELINEFSDEERRDFDDELRRARSRLPLAAIRSALGATQSDVSKLLDVSQAAVSRLEARNDVLLSTLWSFIDALGAVASLRVDHADHKFVVRATRNSAEDRPRWVFEMKEAARESFGHYSEAPWVQLRGPPLRLLEPTVIESAANDPHWPKAEPRWVNG